MLPPAVNELSRAGISGDRARCECETMSRTRPSQGLHDAILKRIRDNALYSILTTNFTHGKVDRPWLVDRALRRSMVIRAPKAPSFLASSGGAADPPGPRPVCVCPPSTKVT